MISTSIPGAMYDSWMAFLPQCEDGVQRLTLEREDTKQQMSLSFIKGNEGDFEQNFRIFMQDQPWPRACEKVLRVWIDGLQHFVIKALPLVETLKVNQSKVLSFVEIQNYTATLATMIRFKRTWDSRKGLLKAVASTRSQLASSQYIAPFKASIASIEDLFDKNIHPLLSLGLKFEAIDLYAKELLKKPKESISEQEIAWVKETKNYIDRIQNILSVDLFFNQRVYARETIQYLCDVITHVTK